MCTGYSFKYVVTNFRGLKQKSNFYGQKLLWLITVENQAVCLSADDITLALRNEQYLVWYIK